MKKFYLFLIIILILIVIVILGFIIRQEIVEASHHEALSSAATTNSIQPSATSTSAASSATNSNQLSQLNINGAIIHLELATTTAEQEQGLSDRTSLAQNAGLLFVFDHPDYWAFWMKDMNFPLDMIWLDKNFKVVYIEKNAPPSSYPEAFTPSSPASYVIEVDAGFADIHGITVGSVLNIK